MTATQFITRIRDEPMRGRPLIAASLLIWLAAAVYCRGYETLLQGTTEWRGSLIWSAIAVLPWFGFFEWSKRTLASSGVHRVVLLSLCAGMVAAASVLLEYLWRAGFGQTIHPIGFLLVRRIPPALSVLALLLLQSSRRSQSLSNPERLTELAQLADHIVAADNYIELHLPTRVVMQRITLTQAEQALRGRGFVRIHRRYLANRAKVLAVELNGRGTVHLESGVELPIGAAYLANAAALVASRTLA